MHQFKFYDLLHGCFRCILFCPFNHSRLGRHWFLFALYTGRSLFWYFCCQVVWNHFHILQELGCKVWSPRCSCFPILWKPSMLSVSWFHTKFNVKLPQFLCKLSETCSIHHSFLQWTMEKSTWCNPWDSMLYLKWLGLKYVFLHVYAFLGYLLCPLLSPPYHAALSTSSTRLDFALTLVLLSLFLCSLYQHYLLYFSVIQDLECVPIK